MAATSANRHFEAHNMKRLLLFLPFAATLLALAYCRATAPATSPVPPTVQAPKTHPNVAVGNGSAQSCYANADFVLKFNSEESLGRVTVSIDGETCAYPNVEVFAESRHAWLGVWGANYVRIMADGTTEGNVEGRIFTFQPTDR